MAEKLSYDQAQKEISEWLGFKHISERKRKDNEDQEEVLIDNMTQGLLSVNDDKSLRYKLKEPLKSEDGDVLMEEINFKPRIRVSELNKRLKGIKANDIEGRMLAYIAAITGENTGKIGQLYTEDYEVCSAIVNYFL